MNKNIFLSLLAKETANTITQDEKRQLEEALQQDSHYNRIYKEFHCFMEQEETFQVDTEAKLLEIWDKIEKNIDVLAVIPIKKRRGWKWASVAASLLILVVAGLLYMQIRQDKADIYSETITSENQNIFAVLDDGTQVWLNKNSTLNYNAGFGVEERNIRLKGEAFFDVAHNPDIPLTVTADKVDVVVKGTAFNVNSYQTNEVEVALLRGLVAVKTEKRKEVLLFPSQKLRIKNGVNISLDSLQIIKGTPTDTIAAETRWMDDLLVFKKQKLEDLVKLMESLYKTTIVIENPTLRQQQFTGSIKNESLYEILDALKQSYPFSYEKRNNTVIIK